MNQRIRQVLEGSKENYIFPFFWQHGETEEELRHYMKVIHEANIRAVCVESRPHPDYCGPKWWADLDVLIDEAKKRQMKIWILDDSHFPTGYANGAMKEQPEELCRQVIYRRVFECGREETLFIPREALVHPLEFGPNGFEEMAMPKGQRVYQDDQLLGIVAFRRDRKEWLELTELAGEEGLRWEVPEGDWRVYVLQLTRNRGPRREYINLLNRDSVHILIQEVYEPHYAHYGQEFGKTIAGFFSDEPELGNGHMYEDVFLGMEDDLPWSPRMAAELKKQLGSGYPGRLALLWENGYDHNETAQLRYQFMDVLTKLVAEEFSMTVGSWCRSHGVEYVGHLIEDNDMHARTGSSLGHYFRGLWGQDMAGVDVIGNQVIPQGEDEIREGGGGKRKRNGRFFHYMLGNLGSSLAALDPKKKGRAMCEIFGAYGWSEGVRLEKYLVDHFLVRGINHFVPHAFTAKEYPDPDCPPHFYANGNNPQYRHFGELMAYTNRLCHLLNGGRHVAPVGILYHGEGEWTGAYMPSYEPARVLADNQVSYDYIPQDVFGSPKAFGVRIHSGSLKINTQNYRMLLVPWQEYVTRDFAKAVGRLRQNLVPVVFVGGYPIGLVASGDEPVKDTTKDVLLGQLKDCPCIELDELEACLEEESLREISFVPADSRIRCYHYQQGDGAELYFLINEGIKPYQGRIFFQQKEGYCYRYFPWENRVLPCSCEGGLELAIEPCKSQLVVFDQRASREELESYLLPELPLGERELLAGIWKRSVCRSVEYPCFGEEKEVTLPDCLAEELPEFSGFVRYRKSIYCKAEEQVVLELTDAREGVELFVNGVSLGIQIVPCYRWELTGLREGENEIVIEVATTLERECAKVPNRFGICFEVSSLTGITGTVYLYRTDKEEQDEKNRAE